MQLLKMWTRKTLDFYKQNLVAGSGRSSDTQNGY